MPKLPEVSVVLASHNEGAFLRTTVDCFLRTLGPRDEVIVVDDCSTDGSAEFLRTGYRGVRLVEPTSRLGAAEARNVGAEIARGETIVFSDAHVEVDLGWLAPLRRALEDPGVGAVAPGIASILNPRVRGFGHTWKDDTLEWRWLSSGSLREPYAVPFVPAGFVALRREVFFETGGFDRGLVIWGSIGDELSLRLWLRGKDCVIAPDVQIRHFFRTRAPYALDWAAILHNMLRMAVLHFDDLRADRLFARLSDRSAFPAAVALLDAGDARHLRSVYREKNTRNPDAFFSRFEINVFDTPSLEDRQLLQ